MAEEFNSQTEAEVFNLQHLTDLKDLWFLT